jgi:hypothetical protein
MADDPKPTPIPAKPLARIGRSKDFRVVYTNSFRFRASHADVAVCFSYQTELPGDQTILQDEVEVVLVPSTLKLLQMAINDNVEAIEKVLGTITLPPEVLEQLAAAKAETLAKAQAEPSPPHEQKGSAS